MILLLRWFTALHMYKRLSQYAGRLESSTTFQGATDLLCPLTDVTYIEEVEHLVPVIFSYVWCVWCCFWCSDFITVELACHWRTSPAPGVPIPASSFGNDRFSLPCPHACRADWICKYFPVIKAGIKKQDLEHLQQVLCTSGFTSSTEMKSLYQWRRKIVEFRGSEVKQGSMHAALPDDVSAPLILNYLLQRIHPTILCYCLGYTQSLPSNYQLLHFFQSYTCLLVWLVKNDATIDTIHSECIVSTV